MMCDQLAYPEVTTRSTVLRQLASELHERARREGGAGGQQVTDATVRAEAYREVADLLWEMSK